jgi:23S rRNA (guanosine2251-2'-O)-methyltransferase
MYSDKRDRTNDDIIAGRNPVLEALKAGREIDSLLIARETFSGSAARIISICKDKGIVVKEVSPAKLDTMCSGINHQGVVAIVAAHAYAELEDILEVAKNKNEPPFLIIADEINDPHNLGAIIRTAEAAGAHGIIIPKRNSVGLTMSVAKASAGAVEYMPVARVANLVSTIEELKKLGIWVYGADTSGNPVFKTDFSGAVAIVVGSEGNGISKLLKEKCDFLVALPMNGKIDSLNVSVACGIIIYEVVRARYLKS